jgi:hypothetical protein
MSDDSIPSPGDGLREHELKCWPEYFHAIRSGEKNFELRLTMGPARREIRVPRLMAEQTPRIT